VPWSESRHVPRRNRGERGVMMDKQLQATERTTISIFSPEGSGNFYWEKGKIDEFLEALADALNLYLHTDPCDDESCPCRKAEADHWRDQGLARP